jgi:pantoate--beta-alanine ligase
MKVLRTRAEMQAWRAGAAGPLAFVPTMGFLHEGHLSLLREGRRRAEGGSLVLSIFVNPTQFGPREDLDRYPRDEAGDLAKAERVGSMWRSVRGPRRAVPVRDAHVGRRRGAGSAPVRGGRPGHFRGVCTVVAKLWGLVRPDVGLFGEKDFQQLAILKRMHAELGLVGEVVGMPIVREADGLAMSSRNVNLKGSARQEALAIPRYLAGVRGDSRAGSATRGRCSGTRRGAGAGAGRLRVARRCGGAAAGRRGGAAGAVRGGGVLRRRAADRQLRAAAVSGSGAGEGRGISLLGHVGGPEAAQGQAQGPRRPSRTSGERQRENPRAIRLALV